MKFKRVKKNLVCIMLDSTGRQVARIKTSATAIAFQYGDGEAYLILPETFMVQSATSLIERSKTYAFYHVGNSSPVDWRTHPQPIPTKFIFELGFNNYIHQVMDKAGGQRRQEVMAWIMLGVLVVGLATVAYLTSQPDPDTVCLRSMAAHAWGYENSTVPLKC